MEARVRQLAQSVRVTVALLLAAGTLIVIGIFNETLKWDIFGPKVEAVLYGVFFSCIVLAVIGVAMTLVLGIRDVVHSFQAIERSRSGREDREVAPGGTPARYFLRPLAALLAVVSLLAGTDWVVQSHRARVFRRLAADQLTRFEPRIAGLASGLTPPPRSNVSPELYDMIKSLDDLPYVMRTTLYLPDPGDPSAMWGYTAWRDYQKADGFAKFFVSQEFEHAMAEAVHGSEARLRDINGRNDLIYYHVVKDAAGRPLGVVRLDADPGQSFREYPLGS